MISVVTITFNNFEELISTLKSLERADGIESVVINGGNCPQTQDYLKNYFGPSLSEKDSGISDAFNKGWKKASGDAILYLNSGDVLIDPTYLSEANRILQNRDVDFIYADILFADPTAGELLIRSGASLPNMPFNHPTLIVRKEIFELIGGFDLNYKIAMDLDFVYRMLKVSQKGYYISKPVVRMDGRGVSSSRHYKVLKEKTKVALNNKDYSFRTFLILIRQLIIIIIKKILSKLRLLDFIDAYRKSKYRS